MAKLIVIALALLACALPLAAASSRQIPADEALELANDGRELQAYYNDVGEIFSCVFSVGPFDCLKARSAATQASNRAIAYANARAWTANSLHNGRGDAFRHCFWNALMTRRIGRSQASKVATGHENANKGPAAERSMDLYNNLKGREIGQASSSDSNADARCKAAALNGTLRCCCGF
jgi:hypothetical protein